MENHANRNSANGSLRQQPNPPAMAGDSFLLSGHVSILLVAGLAAHACLSPLQGIGRWAVKLQASLWPWHLAARCLCSLAQAEPYVCVATSKHTGGLSNIWPLVGAWCPPCAAF